LPTILNKLGYTTTFMHGGVRASMSFVAFSKKNGISRTFSLEEYEQERGKGDYDGSWGIWDHKFVDYAADKIIEMPKPLFTTIFSLSSHSPFKLPDDYSGEVVEGTMPIHKTIRYTDGVLRDFFAKLSREPFYDNTLFIITADHSSGGDSEKFRKVPHSFSIPIIFYKPNSTLKGEISEVAGHIDIMPTLVAALGYNEPYFGFGRDLFAQQDSTTTPFTINYFGGAFNIVTDSTTYLFNERDIISTIGAQRNDTTTQNRAKALIQQYYTHIKNMNFLPRK
ncbi:MAG: LTA synthase family protein, partial [Bacteroidales bacterium]